MPFVVEMHKVLTRQQQQILFYILRRLPRFVGAALDATGSGETLAEDTADAFGHNRIQQVTRAWYGAWMPKFVQLFEDATLTLPKDDSLPTSPQDAEPKSATGLARCCKSVLLGWLPRSPPKRQTARRWWVATNPMRQ